MMTTIENVATMQWYIVRAQSNRERSVSEKIIKDGEKGDLIGKIGKTEQAACILSNNLYILLLVFSIGMSYALTPSVTDANVRESESEKASLFKNSLFVNMLVSVFLFLILFLSSPLLAYMQQPEDVVKLAIPFFNVLIFSIIPVTLFFVCKQYSEGLSNTKAAMYISVIGNIINVILNYVLINGKMGLPEMGYMGSCWASFIAWRLSE